MDALIIFSAKLAFLVLIWGIIVGVGIAIFLVFDEINEDLEFRKRRNNRGD